jgi:hypothetical protein
MAACHDGAPGSATIPSERRLVGTRAPLDVEDLGYLLGAKLPRLEPA